MKSTGRPRRLARSPTLPVSLAAFLAAACGSGGGGAVVRTLPAGDGDGAFPAHGTAWVIFGPDTVHAEVASTPAAREQGLMGREAVPDGTGMLFVFPKREELLLWMKDTPVALDAAIFDDRNRVVAIRQLKPLDRSLIDTGVATALLLEVRQGWFAERGIEVGAVAVVVYGAGVEVS